MKSAGCGGISEASWSKELNSPPPRDPFGGDGKLAFNDPCFAGGRSWFHHYPIVPAAGGMMVRAATTTGSLAVARGPIEGIIVPSAATRLAETKSHSSPGIVDGADTRHESSLDEPRLAPLFPVFAYFHTLDQTVSQKTPQPTAKIEFPLLRAREALLSPGVAGRVQDNHNIFETALIFLADIPAGGCACGARSQALIDPL